MKRGRVRTGAIAIALCAIVASACARPVRERAPGTIQVDIETSPTSTDPRFATDAISSRVDELVFDSLVKVSTRTGNSPATLPSASSGPIRPQ